MIPIYRTPQSKPMLMAEYENILQRWPQPNERHFIPTRLGDTFVISSGAPDGSPVILLHGSTTNAALWMYDAAVLGATRRVYAVDVIGEPGKSADNRPIMEDGVYAQWLAEVMDGLGVPRAAIVGNSLGGWLALELATHLPRRVNAIVLLAPAGLGPIRRSFFLRMLPSALMGKRGAQHLNHLLFGTAHIPEEVYGYAELLRKHYNPRQLKFPIFSNKAIAALKMPVLFIGGEIDPLLPTQTGAKRLRRLLPDADVRIAPGLSHAIIDTAQDVKAFLDKHGI
jgi:Predicted hydrolases or acyltransferases (alpha/beta hydrolase superfamily)